MRAPVSTHQGKESKTAKTWVLLPTNLSLTKKSAGDRMRVCSFIIPSFFPVGHNVLSNFNVKWTQLNDCIQLTKKINMCKFIFELFIENYHAIIAKAEMEIFYRVQMVFRRGQRLLIFPFSPSKFSIKSLMFIHLKQIWGKGSLLILFLTGW